MALVHGALAATGLVLLTVAALGAGGPQQARVALELFVVAALGGFVLFSFHLRKNSPSVKLLLTTSPKTLFPFGG